jgi:hypothetical protein
MNVDWPVIVLMLPIIALLGLVAFVAQYPTMMSTLL